MTVTKDGVKFEGLEPMPYGGTAHCIAAVNETTLFVTGLGSSHYFSYMYYADTKEWVSLPNMPTRREGMGCGVVRDENGKIEVVVVGGAIDNLDTYLNTVEVFNVAENSWRTGEFFKQCFK